MSVDRYFSRFDYAIIALYFCGLIALCFHLKKRASASLEDYFLGARRMPWYLLGISGMAYSLDMTGTMLIVSFLYLMGPRGLFVEFRGGANLVLIFMMLWTGKWHRRSGCMTGAEWNIFRFGPSAGGQATRLINVAATLAGVVGMLAYMIKGNGLFLATFLPLAPFWCALAFVAVATLYTVVSGFYGVVYTDLLQCGIIVAAVIVVSVVAV
jgi:solute:Na+ symporter, SSS family